MLRPLLKKILYFFRVKLGTEEALKRIKQCQIQQQGIAMALGNAMKYSAMEAEEVKKTVLYKRCTAIASLLAPMDVEGHDYIRIGKSYDGGYVMLDTFKIGNKPGAAYSFGISDDVSWDEAIADRGIDVFMYDHTINKLPKNHARFHFSKMGVTGDKKGNDLKTLGELLAGNGHGNAENMILKMDIEGCEWDVFTETESSLIGRFSQIVIELHGLVTATCGPEPEIILNVLKKINQTHQVVHLHANGTGIPTWVGDLVIPSTIEVTYLRRADFRFSKNTRTFPTEIDQSTCRDFPDLYLGNFFTRGEDL